LIVPSSAFEPPGLISISSPTAKPLVSSTSRMEPPALVGAVSLAGTVVLVVLETGAVVDVEVTTTPVLDVVEELVEVVDGSVLEVAEVDVAVLDGVEVVVDETGVSPLTVMRPVTIWSATKLPASVAPSATRSRATGAQKVASTLAPRETIAIEPCERMRRSRAPAPSPVPT
jgi:hypothetical protein